MRGKAQCDGHPGIGWLKTMVLFSPFVDQSSPN